MTDVEGASPRSNQDLQQGSSRPLRGADRPAAAHSTSVPPSEIEAGFIAPAPTPIPAAPSLSGSRNRLISADGTLQVSVGVYSDCTGNSPIDASRADIDPCFPGRTYFVGHSPGVFSPLLHMAVGSIITWYDSRGVAQRLRIVSERDFVRNSQPLGLSRPDVVAQFQTCLTTNGSLDRILDAVKA